jgi:hypothetical protein
MFKEISILLNCAAVKIVKVFDRGVIFIKNLFKNGNEKTLLLETKKVNY